MKSENIYLSKFLKTSNDRFELGALADLKDKVLRDWVWLEFKELKDEKYPKQNLFWDNPTYIFGKFYLFLRRYKSRQLSDEDKKEFSDIIQYLDDEKVDDLIELLAVAKQLNWN